MSSVPYPPVETDKNMLNRQKKITLFNFVSQNGPEFAWDLEQSIMQNLWLLYLQVDINGSFDANIILTKTVHDV